MAKKKATQADNCEAAAASVAPLPAAPLPAGLRKHISPHGRITAVSMMKDEGPFVLEWVAHHLAIGFTDIVVYTNDCSDGTDSMLIRLEEMGLAHHRVNAIPPGIRPQPSALSFAQEEPLVGSSDWVMVFDADEFLCIRYGDGTLDDLIGAAKAQGANGIVVTWRIFGSGGVPHGSRAPVTEQYLQAAPQDWNKGWGVKTLFQFDPEHWKLGIHRPKIKNKWLETGFPDSVKWLNGSGQPMEDYFRFRGWRSITRTIGYDWVQMNHYAVKSIDSYAIRKFRGNVNLKKDKYNSDYWALQDRNEVPDDAMLRYSADRSRIFDALLTDPVLNQLHFAALARAEGLLAEFKGTEAYGDMVTGLKAASLLPIETIEAKPPQARDPEKIAALMSRVEKHTSEQQKADRKTPEARKSRIPRLYVSAAMDPADMPDVIWHPNQAILLPADPRLFTPQALTLVEQGKFERSFARNLPKLLGDTTCHAEIGAGCGFVAAHLARLRPNLHLVVQEQDPGHRAAIARIWERNALPQGPFLRLVEGPLAAHPEALAAFLAEVQPTSLALGDPALTPEALRLALARSGVPAPQLIYLTWRLLVEDPDLYGAFEAVFHEAGLRQTLPLDALGTLACRA